MSINLSRRGFHHPINTEWVPLVGVILFFMSFLKIFGRKGVGFRKNSLSLCSQNVNLTFLLK